MAAVADLLDSLDGQDIAYIFVVEGVATMWAQGYYTDIDNLTGTGVSSWIGTAYGARTVKPGLVLPDPIFTQGIDPKTGMIRDRNVRIKLLDDESDYLATLFKSQWDASELTRLGERLAPDEDPAPANKLKWGGGANVAVRDRHIGNEYIDSSGNRRALYITPAGGSAQPSGMDHPVLNSIQDAELPHVYVSTEPHTWAGRRCAIYRVVYDRELGVWANWLNQYNGGALIWYGTLTGRAVYKGDGVFELNCAGPASWLRKSLGLHFATRPIKASASLNLNTEDGVDERWNCVAFSRRGWDGNTHVSEGYEYNYHSSNKFGASDSIDTIAQMVSDLVESCETGTETGVVAALTNTSTADGVYDTDGIGTGGFDPNDGRSAQVQIDENVKGYEGMLRIGLHAKVWAALGWDVVSQQGMGGGSGFTPWDETYHHVGNTNDHDLDPPGPGYWWGLFSTRRAFAQPEDADNGGIPVNFEAKWKNPLLILDPAGGQRITLGFSPRYAKAQKARPFANGIQVNGTDCNAMGWFVFRGLIQRQGDEEPRDYVQVARCSWVEESDGSIRANSDGAAELYVEAWEDPRVFGFDEKRMQAEWIVEGGKLEVQQLIVLSGYRNPDPTSPDDNWRVLTRILLSGGEVGNWTWVGDDPDPPAPGGNSPGSGDFWGDDLEDQDLGLNCEGDRVDYPAFERVAGEGLQKQTRLNRFRLASFDAVQAQDVIKSICTTRAWCMRWTKGTTGPQFSILSPFLWQTPEDVDVTLTESDIHGRAGDPGSWVAQQDIGWEAAIDTFEVTAGHNPVDGSLTYTLAKDSFDAWRRGRGGNNPRRMAGLGLMNPRYFRGNNEGWARWQNAWVSLHARQVGPWYAETHFTVKTKRLAGAKANKLYPGAIVKLTDQRVLGPDGTYGVTGHVGYVLTVSHFQGGEAEAEILMQGRTVNSFRFWAPLGEVDEYDLTAKTFTLIQDMAEHGGAQKDADGFAEPDWSSHGGTLEYRIIQSRNGRTFETADDVTGDLASVAGNVLTYSTISGKLLPSAKKYIFCQKATDHATDSWPYKIHAKVTDETGDFSGNQALELY